MATQKIVSKMEFPKTNQYQNQSLNLSMSLLKAECNLFNIEKKKSYINKKMEDIIKYNNVSLRDLRTTIKSFSSVVKERPLMVSELVFSE
tara:strand:+ start:1342 stop:1611 length:270 start_codon:yes stop_codon:yes gene_type:complete